MTTTNHTHPDDTRYIGKATPKGVVIKALSKGECVGTYFVAISEGGAKIGEPKRMPGFELVTGEEAETVLFMARRSFNRLTSGEISQWN
jgi:hypothetical protein